MKHLYKYENGELVEFDKDIEPGDEGYIQIDTYGAEHQCSELWEKEGHFIVMMNVNDNHADAVHIDGVPNLLNFIRDYLNPLLNLQSMSTGFLSGE